LGLVDECPKAQEICIFEIEDRGNANKQWRNVTSPTYFDLYQEKYRVCEKRTNFQAKHPISSLTFNNVLNANFPKHTYLLGCNVETKISSPRGDMRR